MSLERLSAARLWLIGSPPPNANYDDDSPRAVAYLAQALYAMTPVLEERVFRLSVDEHWRVYANPLWLARASIPEIGRELAHVTWHLLLDHATRARQLQVTKATAPAWGKSADVAIAEILAAESMTPPELLTANILDLPEQLSAEEYFAILGRLEVDPPDHEGDPDGVAESPESSDHAGCGSGADGVQRPHELPAEHDEVPAISPGAADGIRSSVAIAYQGHCTTYGLEPGALARWVAGLLRPTIAWEPLLSAAVRRAVGWTSGGSEPTYTRPNRRQSAIRGVVLPGKRRPVPTVAMVIDTSGSVDDTLLARALGEVESALASLGIAGGSVTVLDCDAAVYEPTTIRSVAELRLTGGGGTDMRVGIGAAAALRPTPEVIVVFTDGFTPWPEHRPPASTVVIALLGRHTAELPPTPEWATRVECLLD